jgi:hypothetical protein
VSPEAARGTSEEVQLADATPGAETGWLAMTDHERDVTAAALELLVSELSSRIAPRVAELLDRVSPTSSPWLTTIEAIEYSRLPEGTFRKLAASGTIPCHGGRAKVFYRPEIDQALLDFRGIAEEEKQLRRVR